MKAFLVSDSPSLIRYIFTERKKTALFSMLLTAESVGGAELTLGGIDDTKFEG